MAGGMMQSQIKSVGDSPLTSVGVESKPKRQRSAKNEQWGIREGRTESDVKWGKIPSALLAAALGKQVYFFLAVSTSSTSPSNFFEV